MIIEGHFEIEFEKAIHIFEKGDTEKKDLDTYAVVFKSAVVNIGDIIIEKHRIFKLLDIEMNKIESVTFDVFGLNSKPTEMEIHRDFLVCFPKREEQQVYAFLMKLKDN